MHEAPAVYDCGQIFVPAHVAEDWQLRGGE